MSGKEWREDLIHVGRRYPVAVICDPYGNISAVGPNANIDAISAILPAII